MQTDYDKKLNNMSFPIETVPLVAKTSYGYFGLSNLFNFVSSSLEPHFEESPDSFFILDFTSVKYWDIAAVLWLIVGLNYFKQEGCDYCLRLPEGRLSDNENDKSEFDKSADYLRRWGFDTGLKNIVADISSLLADDQKDYFTKGQQYYYLPAEINLERGLADKLISRNLTNIKNLVDLDSSGQLHVNDGLINKCIKTFSNARMADILRYNCGIEETVANSFCGHLVTESLLNVKEHPNATIGMIAVSVTRPLKGAGELILTVADNGDSIPQTIYSVYKDELKDVSSELPLKYDRDSIEISHIESMIDFSTKPGVTRKKIKENPMEDAGLGLTYIKEDAVDRFHGKLEILSEGVRLTYKKKSSNKPAPKLLTHPWKGNLVRISIPLM